jgi:tetratricopeptide (TPR) repeat protein
MSLAQTDRSGSPRLALKDEEWSERGFRAFKKERFGEAIQAWGSLAPASLMRLKPALAEAHFRRAMGQADRQAAIRDLQAALEAVPEDGRFWYHLGLALHREGDRHGAGKAYAQAARHGFPRQEALAYVQGLLALETAPAVEAPGRARALPGLCLEEDLLSPIRALLRQDWATLAAGAPVPAAAKGTPFVPGMASLLRGIGQVGLGQWTQGLQTLGALSQDLFPAPMEALRAVFLGRAMERAGRSGDARKLRTATLSRTGNATLAAEVAETALADLEVWLEEGRWVQVATVTRDLLKHFPCPRARVAAAIALDHLGREAAAAGRWGEAAGHWNELLRLGGEALPGAVACAHNLALAYEGQEQWDQAATAWEAALAALPKRITKLQVKSGAAYGGLSPEALLQRRDWIERRALELRQRTGQVEEILRQRKALIKRTPQDLQLRLEQVETLMNLDEDRAAEREILAILRLAPDHPGALEASARLLLSQGLPKAAEPSLRRVLALEPGRVSARTALAEALAAQAEHLPRAAHKEAARMLAEAIELAPKDGGFRLMLATCFLEGRAPDQAALQIEAALRLGKGAWRLVFRFWAEREDLAQAKALVERGKATGMLEPAFFTEAGLDCLHVAEDDPFRELAYPRRAGGKAAKGESARAAKAQAWLALGQALLEQAVALDPDVGRLRDLVGALIMYHPDLALPYAERAAALSPADPMVLLDLAVAQSGAGQVESARKTLLKVERAARTHKNREEAVPVLELLRLVPVIGVESLHDSFCRLMMAMEGPGDFDLDAEGIPF